MTPPADDVMLAHAARRAQTHPQFLGWVLARYGALQQVSQENMANMLGVTPGDWLRVGLCLRPRTAHFADDVRQISTRFHIDAVALARVVRLVESVEAMTAEGTQVAVTEGGLLMAARARKKQTLYSGKKKTPKKPADEPYPS